MSSSGPEPLTVLVTGVHIKIDVGFTQPSRVSVLIGVDHQAGQFGGFAPPLETHIKLITDRVGPRIVLNKYGTNKQRICIQHSTRFHHLEMASPMGSMRAIGCRAGRLPGFKTIPESHRNASLFSRNTVLGIPNGSAKANVASCNTLEVPVPPKQTSSRVIDQWQSSP